jgi:hypothetical protein
MSAFLFSAPQAPPTGNVGKATAGNVGTAPRGNVGTFPQGNGGNFPRGNVGSFPRGNVDNYPRGNTGSYPRGSVDRDPSNPLNTKAASRVKSKDGKDNGKGKPGFDADRKATTEKSKRNKGDKGKNGDDKPARPGVTGPIVIGMPSSSATVIEDLERVRLQLNRVGFDYQGRRAAAVNNVTHAIHLLRYGRNDPNPDASFVSSGNNERRTVSDLSLRVAQGELRAIGARLGTNAYFHGSAAAAAVERAIQALENALKPV